MQVCGMLFQDLRDRWGLVCDKVTQVWNDCWEFSEVSLFLRDSLAIIFHSFRNTMVSADERLITGAINLWDERLKGISV